MDEVDTKLIDFLIKDSRASFRKIAKQTGLSVDTVMRRYQRLEKEKVIQPTITVDLVKLGYEAMVFFGLKIASQNSSSQIIEETLKIPDVTAAMATTGEYDLTLIANVRNITHTFKIGEDISEVKGVKKVIIDEILLPFDGNATFPPAVWHNLHLER